MKSRLKCNSIYICVFLLGYFVYFYFEINIIVLSHFFNMSILNINRMPLSNSLYSFSDTFPSYN